MLICGILGKGLFFFIVLYCFVFFIGYLSIDVCDILMIFKGKNIWMWVYVYIFDDFVYISIYVICKYIYVSCKKK